MSIIKSVKKPCIFVHQCKFLVHFGCFWNSSEIDARSLWCILLSELHHDKMNPLKMVPKQANYFFALNNPWQQRHQVAPAQRSIAFQSFFGPSDCVR